MDKMDKALVFGTKDCRFESCQGHVYSLRTPLPSKLHSTRARGGKTDKLNGLKFSSSARGYSAHVSRSAHGCSGHVTHKSRGQPGVGALQAGRRLTPGLAVLCDISARPHIFRRPCGLMDKALVSGTKDCRFESCQGHVYSLCMPLPHQVPQHGATWWQNGES